MTNDQGQGEPPRTNFFISYTSKDCAWAEWIAWHLEKAGYHTIIQAWDIRPGSNFVAEMDEAAKQAERTIPVLSEAYLASDYAFAEWAVAFRADPRGKQGKVLPVRIQRCRIEGLLRPIGYIDLVDLDEQRAREKLLAGVQRGRAKPASAPFPTSTSPSGPLVNHPVFPGSLPLIWNIPYPQNPLFTGREELLTQLATTLHAGQPTALSQPQAINGLGGIGKTQLALEYAYRYRGDYQAVLWARADTHENLTASYLTIATLLNLPEKSEQESARVIAAVKLWFQHNTGWLLILDNADDLTLARDFLPPSLGGHVLLTTRAQAMGRFARCLEVNILPIELGALFLLRRAGLLPTEAPFEQASEHDRNAARAICEELGGLPLALDQAGAYIEETRCSLSDYQQRYQTRRTRLLQRRGGLVADHPDAVATTWSLAFEKVEQANPAAADLLRLCAFLAPDAIPEEIITEGVAHLGPTLEPVASDPTDLDEAIAALGAYSLIRRNTTEKTLSVHRLIQATLRANIAAAEEKEWKQRVVQAAEVSFPDLDDMAKWNACELWLPHAQVCTDWITQENMINPEATELLNKAGCYLKARARYTDAERLLVQALEIRKKQLGIEHVLTAESMNSLATLRDDQGNYEQAELLYQEALRINEQLLGAEHPSTALSLNNLGFLYKKQGKYEQAEPLLVRALKIRKKQLGTEHILTAQSMSNLAALYDDQGRYAEAEPLYKEALRINEQLLGAEHPGRTNYLNNLAEVYRKQGRYAEAELLYKEALRINEQLLGDEHPSTAAIVNNLAELYRIQGKYTEAEQFLKRALGITEKLLGTEHPDTVTSRNNLALLYTYQGKYAEAEQLHQQVLEIREKHLGANHPHTASSLCNLALLYLQQGKYEQAEPLYERALRILEQQLGPEHPEVGYPLTGLASLYLQQGKYEQAEPLYERALHIREQQLGPEHPEMGHLLNNLGLLYLKQGKYGKAETLYERALHIWEQQLGPEHPSVAYPLNNLGLLYLKQGKYGKAETLYERALRIREQQLGPEHPEVGYPLTGLANLYSDQGKYAEAQALYERALHIWEQQLGPEHPEVSYPFTGLANLYSKQGKYEQAEPLYEQALHIWEQQLGPEHPNVAHPLTGLANLYRDQDKCEKARPLYERALRIREQQLGSEHPETAEILHDLAAFQELQGNHQEALSLYHRALTIREQVLGPEHSKTRATCQRLIALS